jgi:hypothetical protein
MKATSIVLMFITITICGKAQEEKDEYRGFSFGLRLGSYFASSKTANFYNGSGALQSGVSYAGVQYFSIQERIDFLKLTPAAYNEMLGQFNATGIEVPFDSSPMNMRYQPTFSFGLDMRYRFDRYSAIVMQFQSMRVKAGDKYTLRLIGTPAQINAQQDVQLFDISGVEQRFQLALGYRQGWEINEAMDFFFQPGITLNGLRVESNSIRIGNQSYELMLGNTGNPNVIQAYQPRTEVGFGAGFYTGIEVHLGKGHSAEFGVSTYREKMQLWEWEQAGWNKSITASFYY